MPHGYGHTSNLVRVDAQGRVAPPGYHFMPDGSLMSDERHAELYGGIDKAVLLGIKIDYSDIKTFYTPRRIVVLIKGLQLSLNLFHSLSSDPSKGITVFALPFNSYPYLPQKSL